RNAIAQARACGLLNAKTSVHTGAYCRARERLPEGALHDVAAKLGAELMNAERNEDRWHGRRVLVADGSSASLPDTPKNQACYPQPSAQAAGCGFPVMYLCMLMSLASGALLDFATGGGAGNELALWRQLWPLMRPGDIAMGDSLYCGYADVALLLARGVDCVTRLKRRKTDFRKGLIFGVLDHLTVWSCPKVLPAWLEGQVLPAELSVRELRFRVEVPGFRTETITLVTTLTDAELYSKEDLADLFFERWQVELRLRDIKAMLGMDKLRTTTPQRVHKELWLCQAGYNILRTLMYEAAQKAGVPVARMSFQGCRQRLMAAAARPCSARRFPSQYRRLIRDISKDQNPDRPNRIEPRAVKRRPKQYDLLNQPRAILRERLLKAA
ncbi:MAG TPA: IS4 family transposase, partial [Planctomycetota bacterium]|nr:IS4 family transposase [Planctomycetota bacterium]